MSSWCGNHFRPATFVSNNSISVKLWDRPSLFHVTIVTYVQQRRLCGNAERMQRKKMWAQFIFVKVILQYADYMQLPPRDDEDEATDENLIKEEEEWKLMAAISIENSLGIKVFDITRMLPSLSWHFLNIHLFVYS